jgi:hypothetical protein
MHKVLGSINKTRVIELLGCSIESYREYINSLLLEDMKWEDYGPKWCIQHIENVKQPGSTTEEIESRLHYMNTKPVWGSLGKRQIFK